jgi:putative DNA primase/helicase
LVTPTFGVWLITNKLPKIEGTDFAIWRRVNRIPFNVKIADRTEPVKDFHEQLLAEADGILAWIAEGCRAWYETGLNPPEAVKTAAQEYRSEQDLIGRFLSETTTKKKDGRLIKAHQIFVKWCHQSNENPVSASTFNARLVELEVLPGREKTGRFYCGLEWNDAGKDLWEKLSY